MVAIVGMWYYYTEIYWIIICTNSFICIFAQLCFYFESYVLYYADNWYLKIEIHTRHSWYHISSAMDNHISVYISCIVVPFSHIKYPLKCSQWGCNSSPVKAGYLFVCVSSVIYLLITRLFTKKSLQMSLVFLQANKSSIITSTLPWTE